MWRGGLAYYGGFIFAAAFGLYYARKHRLGMWKMADLAAPWIALGLALTRIGCFLNGCCFGKVCDPALGGSRSPANRALHEAQVGRRPHPAGAATLPVHPTQLYLAALNLLTFFLLYVVLRSASASTASCSPGC